MSKFRARHWWLRTRSLLLFLTPLLVLVLGTTLSIFVFTRLQGYELAITHKENSQRVQDIARQIDLSLSNSLLRVQSYEEYLGPREVNYSQESSFIRQALHYTVFQRLSIFRIFDAKKAQPRLKRIAQIETGETNLPKSQSKYMQSPILIDVIKKMQEQSEHQESAFFNFNKSSIFSMVLHSKFHSDVYFVFLTAIEKVFEPIHFATGESIFLTDPGAEHGWLISGPAAKGRLNIVATDTLPEPTAHQHTILFDQNMDQSGLHLKFAFTYTSAEGTFSTSRIALVSCLSLTLIFTLLFWLLVSQNKRTTRLVIQRTHDLQKAHHLAQEALMFKTRFIGNISHEIRTPLNMILGMVDLCEERDVDTTIREYLRNMRTSGNHLLEIIEDLLDLAKIETSEVHLQNKPINLLQFLDEIGRVVGQECDKKHLKMHIDVSPDLPTTIMCDPSRLRQILLNLLKNSCKYTNRGFVSLKVRCQDNHFTFEVQDSGIGIPKEKIGTIFEAFVQIENSQALSEGGVGLGLSIVRDLVKKLNGQIQVSSSTAGSLFSVSLDLEVSDATPWLHKYRHPTEKTQKVFLVLSDQRNIELISSVAARTDIAIELVSFSQLNSFVQKFEKAANTWVLIEPFSGLSQDHPLFQKLDLSHTILLGSRISFRESFKNLQVELLNDSPLIVNDLLNHLGFSSRKKPRPVENAAPAEAEKPKVLQSTQRKMSIIVSDDDDGNRELIKAYLNNTPWDIRLTINGLEAWESYLEKSPDLMIVDGRMPIMDGFTLIEKVRAYERQHDLPSCPIILVTADALEQTEKKANTFKDVTYMTKPLRKVKLMDAIEQTTQTLNT